MYVITGKDTSGRRFKPIRTHNKQHAFGINLYNGSIWWENAEGKRELLKRVKNGTPIIP